MQPILRRLPPPPPQVLRLLVGSLRIVGHSTVFVIASLVLLVSALFMPGSAFASTQTIPQPTPPQVSMFQGQPVIVHTTPAEAAYAATSIGISTPYGYFPADGKDHTVTQTVPCHIISECHVIYHFGAIRTKTPIVASSTSIASSINTITPDDSWYNSGYIYSYNSYDVWGGIGNWTHEYKVEVDAENYYNLNTVTTQWTRPYLWSYNSYTCSICTSGSSYDPNTGRMDDWGNFQLIVSEFGLTSTSQVYLNTYVTLSGAYWYSDSCLCR